jgi:hypothetical protein
MLYLWGETLPRAGGAWIGRAAPEGVLMADRRVDPTRRKSRAFPGRLWIAAGTIALVGFILRPLGSYFGRELRYTGIAVIALGLVVAVVAWLGERWSQAKNRK